MTARVEVLSGPLKGTVVPVSGGRLSIGRVAGNHLVLDDSTVSRQHAEVVLDRDTALVRDLGSRNGITVEGKGVKEGRMTSGGKFTVGRIACRFLSDPVPAGMPAGAPSAGGGSAPAADPGKGRDWRFLGFLALAVGVIIAVMAAWYQNANKSRDRELTISLKEGEERYEAIKDNRKFGPPVPRDPQGVLKILKVYTSAVSLRALQEGNAEMDFPFPDGTRLTLKVIVKGQFRRLPPFQVPAEVEADKARLLEFCQVKLAEAKNLAGNGQVFAALQIARGIEGRYYGVRPQPPLVKEAREAAEAWERQIEIRYQQLEEDRRLKAERFEYDKVEAVLYQMRELVDRDTADFQRLKYLLKLNNDQKLASQAKRDR